MSRIYKDKNKLLDNIRKFYEENNRIPVARDFIDNPKYPSFNTYKNIFGSWNKAIELAGFKSSKGGRKKLYKESELLDYIRRFEKENKRIPMEADFTNNPDYPNFATYQNYFGKWNNAIEMAGFEPKEDGIQPYSMEELLDYLEWFYLENNRPPTQGDFSNNPDYPNFATYQNYFGSWQKALKLVNLDVDSMVNNGHIVTNQQKARLFELKIKEHFIEESVDLSGENYLSPFDGISPRGEIYDAKSSSFINNHWLIHFNNKYRLEIRWYYLGLFSIGYDKLLHVLRISTQDFIEPILKGFMRIYLNGNYIYTLENMKKYMITEKFKKQSI